jgi:hypothetical protein
MGMANQSVTASKAASLMGKAQLQGPAGAVRAGADSGNCPRERQEGRPAEGSRKKRVKKGGE